MKSENRLIKKKLGQPIDTVSDTSDASLEKSPLNKLIPVALIGAGLFGMYNKGMLKPIAKGMTEVAESIGNGKLGSANEITETIKKWSTMDVDIPEQLKGWDYPIPKNSIFRGNNLETIKGVSEDITNSVKSKSIDIAKTKRIISDTTDDLNILKTLIRQKEGSVSKIQESYAFTDLLQGMRELKTVNKEIDANMPNVSHAARAITTKTFLEENMLSQAQEADMLKKTGFRPLTIGDIMEQPNKANDYTYKILEDAVINLDDSSLSNTYASSKEITDMFNSSTFRYMRDGKATNMAGDWANASRLILDKDIMIDEAGKLVDLRATRKVVNDLKHSIVTDFTIPGLFNPLTSLLPSWSTGGVRKPMFGVLYEKSFQPFITKMSGQAELGESMLFAAGKVYKEGANNQLEKIADGMVLNDITSSKRYGFNKKIRSLSKMADLGYSDSELRKTNSFTKYMDKVFTFLDSGQSDTYTSEYAKDVVTGKRKRIDELGNVDNFFTDSIYNTFDKVHLYDSVPKRALDGSKVTHVNLFGEEPIRMKKSSNQLADTRRFIVTKKGMSIFDIKGQEGLGNKVDFAQDCVKSFFVGRNKDGTINDLMSESSLRMFGAFDSIFSRLDDIAPQLAFSNKSKASAGSYISNMALKRVLPIYALTQVPGILNAMSEPIFNLLGYNKGEDEDKSDTDNRMNINKFIASKVIKPLDLGLHTVKDKLFITQGIKKIEEFTPGFDQINELPGIYHLGLNQTREEREEYIENGYDPVRKGRYWGLGNTPFTGGKIMYWRPNMYRRIEADVNFSDSKWGSRQEYYNNTWFPNPINPLAPINHFLLDKHHYDKKHYKDRPYLITAPMGSNIPIVGPLFSSTIGSFIKPPKRMHEEYWKDDKPIEKDDETTDIIRDGQIQSAMEKQAFLNTVYVNQETVTNILNKSKNASEKDSYARMNDMKNVKKLISLNNKFLPFKTSPPVSEYVAKNITTGDINLSQYDSDIEAYTTPSGNTQLVDIPDELTTWEANQRLKDYSVKRMVEAKTRVDIHSPNRFAPQLKDYSDEKINNHFIYNMGEQYNKISDLFGMKGFETRTFITGEANKEASIIQDSGYSYSANKLFWDQNIGGLGGDGSEIFRRFLQKQNNSTDYINPIRNTMPDWITGRDYFLDLKHGDPYSKVALGEERLPGAGYERLHDININEKLRMVINSEDIGLSKEQLRTEILGSTITKERESSSQLYNEAVAALVDAKIANKSETRQSYYDNVNDISGQYSALVNDITSRTGKSLVNIKVVDDQLFQEVKRRKNMTDKHREELNYTMWATGNTKGKGYVQYVNKDNTEKSIAVKTRYDNKLRKETINKVKQARKDVNQAYESGEISRGDFYDDMDKLRILSDVAPYSEELAAVKARLATNNKLTQKDKDEISAINQRTTAQKEPLRVYDYKFKSAELTNEKVRVKKIIDNNTILVDKYGTQHAIKLAGIHVSQSNTDMYDEGVTMNDAAAKELKKYLRKGSKITISYDSDENKKYNKDSTESIKAVIHSKGKNINKHMIKEGLAKPKEKDNSPAAIRARYSNNEILVGSMMESITHGIAQLPFIGNKLFQVKSPYEQYRDREVYGKDFQSWSRPIKDYLIPQIDKINSKKNLSGTILGGIIGSLFGKSPYGRMVGGIVGAGIGATGTLYTAAKSTKDSDWVPKRRRDQRELNEYYDTLKYVKSMSLYEKYKHKAIKENNFNVKKFEDEKLLQGVENKNISNELKDFKKVVKLDYKHRKSFNFKYNDKADFDFKQDRKGLIKQINSKLSEVQSDRTIERLPENVIKAINYKQEAKSTMYGYNPGDPLNNLMKALPKKERQYFKHFINAPEMEKEKILKIAPSYLKRGLQQSWGMDIDKKPNLNEYFQTHGLPDSDWIGWNEDTDINDVKVKLVHQNKLDMGEFDIWDEQKQKADKVNIPVPKIKSKNSKHEVERRLKNILGDYGFDDVNMLTLNGGNSNRAQVNIYHDSRDDIEQQIQLMNI